MELYEDFKKLSLNQNVKEEPKIENEIPNHYESNKKCTVVINQAFKNQSNYLIVELKNIHVFNKKIENDSTESVDKENKSDQLESKNDVKYTVQKCLKKEKAKRNRNLVTLEFDKAQNELIKSFASCSLSSANDDNKKHVSVQNLCNNKEDASCPVSEITELPPNIHDRGAERSKKLSQNRVSPLNRSVSNTSDGVKHNVLHLSGCRVISSETQPQHIFNTVSSENSNDISNSLFKSFSEQENYARLSPESGYGSPSQSDFCMSPPNNSFENFLNSNCAVTTEYAEKSDSNINIGRDQNETSSAITELLKMLQTSSPVISQIPTDEKNDVLNDIEEIIENEISVTSTNSNLTEKKHSSKNTPLEFNNIGEITENKISPTSTNSTVTENKYSSKNTPLEYYDIENEISTTTTNNNLTEKVYSSKNMPLEYNINGINSNALTVHPKGSAPPVVIQINPLTVFTFYVLPSSISPNGKSKHIAIRPKPTKTIQDLQIPSSGQEVSNVTTFVAKEELKNTLNYVKLEYYMRKIYISLNENKAKDAIFIENEQNKQSNLHLAVQKNEVEHVFAIVEIHKQYEGKNYLTALNLRDSFGKTALNYASQNRLLSNYLEESGVRKDM